MRFEIDPRRSEADLDSKVAVVQNRIPDEKDKVEDRVPAVPRLPVGVVTEGPAGLRVQDRVLVVREKVPVST